MSYNDKILARYDASMDDEFEREMLYRSIAISYTWAIWLLYIAFAVLAWVLPGVYAILVILPIAALIIAMATGDSWLRKRAPYPRLNGYSKLEQCLMVLISLAVIAGVIWNLSSIMDRDFSIGGAIGALAGIAASAFILKYLSTHQRRKDRERLEAQLEED
ncbi:hypothetical protein [Rothia terrae]|uniref:hypothetical protein n=1 Tax=Rothia terrae TaxID=396015 RepID=UPI0034119F45